MKKLISQLLSRGSDKRTNLIKYIEFNGIIYMVIGLSFFFLTNILSSMGIIPKFYGNEEGFIQLLGFSVLIIGHYYFFGARTHKMSFCLSTVFGRLLLVPIFFSILIINNALDIGFLIPPLILDILLALGAFYLWIKESSITIPPE